MGVFRAISRPCSTRSGSCATWDFAQRGAAAAAPAARPIPRNRLRSNVISTPQRHLVPCPIVLSPGLLVPSPWSLPLFLRDPENIQPAQHALQIRLDRLFGL